MNKVKSGYLRAASASGECPPLDELWASASGELPADSRELLNQHLAACSWCAEKIARMSDSGGVQGAELPVPEALNRRARQIWRVPLFGRIWQTPWIWMLIFLAALTTSFTTPRFYKQFLVLALVSGIRWALSERAQRHLVTVTRLSGPDSSGRRTSRHHAESNPLRHGSEPDSR